MGSVLPWGYRNEQGIVHALEREQFHDRHRDMSQAKERVLWGQREPTQPYLGSGKSGGIPEGGDIETEFCKTIWFLDFFICPGPCPVPQSPECFHMSQME